MKPILLIENPNFLSRFGTPILLFLFFIPLRRRSKAASKSSSASPVVVPSPPPPTASSPAPVIAQHAPVATMSDGPRKTVATPYAKKLTKQHKMDIRSALRELDHSVGSLRARRGGCGWDRSLRGGTTASPPPAAAKATTTSSSSPPLLSGSSVVPFTAMQSDVSKNMIESLFVPMFRVGYPVNTDALDAPYEKLNVNVHSAGMALAQHPVVKASCKAGVIGPVTTVICYKSRPGEELFELPKQHKKRSIHYTKGTMP
ncbi:unnamed protein product [Brassica napus]|uniref:(rape) hypothetical protein n=1 Tax=Brassica napus TaxID=3708 RepID=A0A816VD47_BRANA|nr:unnamed protein product [Brassica napus]